MLSKNTARAYQIVPDRTSALEDESHTETFKSTRPVTSSPAALEALDFIDTGHFGGDPLLARDLRAVFESLYPSAQDALRLARVARCDLERIRPEASAQAAWFELLEAARASGQTEALLRGALMDFPGHAGLSHCLGALGAHPLDGSVITEDAAELRGALSRLSDAQFEDVVSSLSSVTQLAPTSMMSSPERVIALVRACSERGSLPDLATAIERVRGRA
ncbi:MAG: effector-associated domain EAD1-containing protein [Polyangiales bacterium]